MRSKSHSPEERSVLKAAARRLLPHVHDKDMRGFAQKLIEASRDPAFRADARGGRLVRILPYPQDVVPLATRSRPLEIWRPHADRGAIPLFDAAGLPNGGALVAAGELGALLLSPEGKILARFSSPASHIVMSDNGSRAILLAKRGEAFQLSRLDLRSQRCEPWCNARFDLFAPDFDGLSWFVARGGTLYAIDALASRWEHMWKVDEDAGTIASVRRNANAVSAFFKWKDRFAESWTYDYPSLILRDRCQINQGEGEFTSECVSPSGSFVGWRLYNSYAGSCSHPPIIKPVPSTFWITRNSMSGLGSPSKSPM